MSKQQDRSRGKTVIELRRAAVAKRFNDGESQNAIAAALGFAKSTISADIRAIRREANKAAVDDYIEGREWLVKKHREIIALAMKHFEDSKEQEVLGKAISALREIGRLIGAYEQPEDGQAQINIVQGDQINQQNQVTIVVLEDESWYGHNKAHLKAAETLAAPVAGADLPGAVQGGGVRSEMGQNGHGPANGHPGPRTEAGGDEGGD